MADGFDAGQGMHQHAHAVQYSRAASHVKRVGGRSTKSPERTDRFSPTTLQRAASHMPDSRLPTRVAYY
eukprot:4154001-Pyramimonas_sp.AAC.1